MEPCQSWIEDHFKGDISDIFSHLATQRVMGSMSPPKVEQDAKGLLQLLHHDDVHLLHQITRIHRKKSNKLDARAQERLQAISQQVDNVQAPLPLVWALAHPESFAPRKRVTKLMPTKELKGGGGDFGGMPIDAVSEYGGSDAYDPYAQQQPQMMYDPYAQPQPQMMYDPYAQQQQMMYAQQMQAQALAQQQHEQQKMQALVAQQQQLGLAAQQQQHQAAQDLAMHMHQARQAQQLQAAQQAAEQEAVQQSMQQQAALQQGMLQQHALAQQQQAALQNQALQQHLAMQQHGGLQGQQLQQQMAGTQLAQDQAAHMQQLDQMQQLQQQQLLQQQAIQQKLGALSPQEMLQQQQLEQKMKLGQQPCQMQCSWLMKLWPGEHSGCPVWTTNHRCTNKATGVLQNDGSSEPNARPRPLVVGRDDADMQEWSQGLLMPNWQAIARSESMGYVAICDQCKEWMDWYKRKYNPSAYLKAGLTVAALGAGLYFGVPQMVGSTAIRAGRAAMGAVNDAGRAAMGAVNDAGRAVYGGIQSAMPFSTTPMVSAPVGSSVLNPQFLAAMLPNVTPKDMVQNVTPKELEEQIRKAQIQESIQKINS